MFNRMKRLLGNKIFFLLLSIMPLGILIGFIEICFSFTMQSFLFHFKIIKDYDFPEYLNILLDINPIFLLLFVTFIRMVLVFISKLLPNIFYETFLVRIRNLISNAALNNEKRDETSLSTIEVSHILTNVVPKSSIFINGISQLIIKVFNLITLFAGIMLLSYKLFGFSFILTIFLGFPILIFKSSYRHFSSKVYIFTDKYIKELLRALRNIYLLKIMGMNKIEFKNLKKINKSILVNQIKYSLLLLGNSSWPEYLGIIIIVCIIYFNSKLMFIPQVLIISFIYILMRLFDNCAKLMDVVGKIQFHYPFYNEMIKFSDHLFKKNFEEMDSNKEKFGLKKELQLSVKNLAVGINDKIFIKGVEFQIQSGNFLLIQGESGKGKTTLLMTIIGLLEKKSGNIYWNNLSIDNIDMLSFRNNLSYSGADPFLLDGTIKDNILYGSLSPEEDSKKIPEILDLVCGDFVYTMDNGLEYKLTEGGEGISAGQKQRISLARALLREANVLILDEATANIDEVTEEKLITGIQKKYENLIIIAVSHRNSMRKFATKIIEL